MQGGYYEIRNSKIIMLAEMLPSPIFALAFIMITLWQYNVVAASHSSPKTILKTVTITFVSEEVPVFFIRNQRTRTITLILESCLFNSSVIGIWVIIFEKKNQSVYITRCHNYSTLQILITQTRFSISYCIRFCNVLMTRN